MSVREVATLAEASKVSPMRWRALVDGDIVSVAVLEARCHAAPWTAGNFRDAIAAGYTTCMAERDGRVVAYGVLSHAPGEAQILNLTVAPEARGEGLGRELVHRFLHEAARQGAEQVFLEVRSSNTAAIGLYEAEGFVSVARRAGYYPASTVDGPREDALVMRRSVVPATKTPSR